jgi:dual oxidase
MTFAKLASLWWLPAVVLLASGLLQFVISEATEDATARKVVMTNRYEQQRYDGWYNNLGHPDWGAVESHLTRKTPPAYADGVYMMSGENRPSPRQLSQAFMKGEDGLGSLMNRTALQTFFGQVGTGPGSGVYLCSWRGFPYYSPYY